MLTRKQITMESIQNAGFDRLAIPSVGNLDSDDLELQYFTALQTMQDWQDIFEVFYANPWFNFKLRTYVRTAARKFSLGSDCYDDIRQEALVLFAGTLQRNRSLGFVRSKGSFSGFVSIIIYRCCLKGLRQFQRQHQAMSDDDFFHPYYEEQAQLEKLLDFRHMVVQIPEPYRGIVGQLLAGESVGSIAKSRKRSKRTIYRWIDRSIELLKDAYFKAGILDVDQTEDRLQATR